MFFVCEEKLREVPSPDPSLCRTSQKMSQSDVSADEVIKQFDKLTSAVLESWVALSQQVQG